LNRTKPWRRRQWTLAHELGHILIHGAQADGQWRRRPAEAAHDAERAADRFAAAFLMPASLMIVLWHKHQNVAQVAAYLGVSDMAVTLRLRELHLLAGPARS